MNNTLELLAPCRTADIGIEAIKHGADAVYIGGPLFSARANAGNSMSEIGKLCEYAHRFNARVYMALNTIFTDEELLKAESLAGEAYNTGVDALIVQDMGLLMCDLPPIQLHASTQCDIRTVQKALFLESVGFSQIVPARELSLEQIREMADTLTTARIEFFIHGALCVSYSGRCYASQAFTKRSANRGDCAQICRLPFDVTDSEGKKLCNSRHVLSLKDNNQSGNLPELIAAGVRSFKIEGRYKDLTYVKNTVSLYRREIDRFIENNPEFEKASDGTVSLNFEPSFENSFNRGATDYFLHGRADHMSAADTPKNSGTEIGTVTKIGHNSFTLKTREELHNGDGLTFFDESGELFGFLVNRAEQKDLDLWEITLRENCSSFPALKPGLRLMRNRDTQWIKKMNAETALRKIPIRIEAKISENRLDLSAEDHAGHAAHVSLNQKLDEAKNAVRAKEQLLSSLGKLGNTDFTAEDIQVSGEAKFLPASALNALRRSLTEQLAQNRASQRKFLEQDRINEDASYPEPTLGYQGNVMNAKAMAFYKKHRTEVTQPAFEKQRVPGETEVMRCRYCIRHEMDLCPKQAKARGEKIKPTPLKLKSGKIEMTANFDCKKCEMVLTTRINA